MIALTDRLSERLDALEACVGRPSTCYVAFSGGLDSTVLLHALAKSRRFTRLLAVHVDHQLHAESAIWAAQAQAEAASFGVDCRVDRVTPEVTAGQGIEAAARVARYAALAERLEPGDWLVTAHHLDDQAETLLLNLLRGSGPDGLAAMPEYRAFAAGWLVRPLLDVSRDELAACAASSDLRWSDDPGNAEIDFDRNYLRHEILPRLALRWPDAARRLARTVERQQEASQLLGEIGADDIAQSGAAGRLQVDVLAALSAPRRRNALRTAIRHAGLPMPPRNALLAIDNELLPAREDGTPLVRWPGGEARRYRGILYLDKPLGEPPDGEFAFSGATLRLPDGLGSLVLEECGEPGIRPELVARGLTVRWRAGGETLRVTPGGPTRALRKLLQEASIVPWMRDRLPLIYAGDDLVAVADRYIAASALASPGTRIRWLDAPAIA